MDVGEYTVGIELIYDSSRVPLSGRDFAIWRLGSFLRGGFKSILRVLELRGKAS